VTCDGSIVLIVIHSVAASILSRIGSEICGGVKGVHINGVLGLVVKHIM